jgi:hypothetical protein
MTLHTLAQAHQAAKAIYDACPFANDASTPEERARIDMVRRIALKRHIDAENAYNAALDAEAERLASETTAHGMAAE